LSTASLARTAQEFQECLESLGVASVQLPYEGRGEWLLQLEGWPITEIRLEWHQGLYEAPDRWTIEYEVKDLRLAQMAGTVFWPVRIRRWPIFGPVIGSRWKGNDGGSGLLSRLNSDGVLLDLAGQSRGQDIMFFGTPSRACWTWELTAWYSAYESQGWPVPSKQTWEYYVYLAKFLLEAQP
jgi:hypothetical protein